MAAAVPGEVAGRLRIFLKTRGDLFHSQPMNADIRWAATIREFRPRLRVIARGLRSRGGLLEPIGIKEGAVQRFEFAFELAWKTLKDYLEASGVLLNPVTPRNVIKEAYAAKLLDDAQVRMDMMLHRNLLSHTYDIKIFETALRTVEERYFPAFDRLHEFFPLKQLQS